MADQDDRLLTVEGQIHALTRAWLCLAAQMEMRGELEPEKLEASLLGARWPQVEFDHSAQQTMAHLVCQLGAARASRQRRGQLPAHQV